MEDGEELIITLNYPESSKVDFKFISEVDFEEVEIEEGKMVMRLRKDKGIKEKLEKGIIIDSKHFPIIIEEKARIAKPEIEECPECKSTQLWTDKSTGEIVCRACGLVIGYKVMDIGPEWRAYSKEEIELKSRVGAPEKFSIHDKGLTTKISDRNVDAFGRRLSIEEEETARRLRFWQKRLRILDEEERSLAYSCSEIDRLKNTLNLPSSVIEEATIIYRKAMKEKLTRGREIRPLATACVYVSCRRQGIPRTLDEILEASIPQHLSFSQWKRSVSRAYRTLIKELEYQVPIHDSIQLTSKILNQLRGKGRTDELKERNDKLEETTYKIVRAAKELRLTSGKDPISIATASVYLASFLTGANITQREIAAAGKVTEVTLRNRCRDLEKSLNFTLYL